MGAHWSLGVLIGLPIFILLLVALLGFGVVAAIAGEAGLAAGSIGSAVVLAVVLLSPLGYYPYATEYHKWQPVSGTVTAVSNRLISDGDKGMNQRFVVKLQGEDLYYGCDDTRCSTIKVGDTVHLSCKREWQYASVSGYGCRWNS
jgi:hypothetical protein